MKIFVWGTGRVAGAVINFNLPIERVYAFIDNDPSKKECMGKPVFCPEDIVEEEYDAIIVCTIYGQEIKEQCLEIGINVDKLIFVCNNYKLIDENKNYNFVKKVVGEEYAVKIQQQYIVIPSMGDDKYGEYINSNEVMFKNDYVRMKTFELVVDEIKGKKVSGDVAEFGVYRGEFAQYINAAFPERTCYLFDSFEGFDNSEIQREISNSNSTEIIENIFKETSIDTVMNRMCYPEKICIKKGYFPESLNGLETTFAFVSIDADYEESIYQGLKYFYPRLNTGGYIFVHDYNTYFSGPKEAVHRYEKEFGLIINKVPICDRAGTLVISK